MANVLRTFAQMIDDVRDVTRDQWLAWLELFSMVILFFIALGLTHHLLGLPLLFSIFASMIVVAVEIWIMSAWRRSRPRKG